MRSTLEIRPGWTRIIVFPNSDAMARHTSIHHYILESEEK
jgi:hypothetical protein